MHMKPVKRGLESHPKEWPWSSFSFYSNGEMGLTRIDPVCRFMRTWSERAKPRPCTNRKDGAPARQAITTAKLYKVSREE